MSRKSRRPSSLAALRERPPAQLLPDRDTLLGALRDESVLFFDHVLGQLTLLPLPTTPPAAGSRPPTTSPSGSKAPATAPGAVKIEARNLQSLHLQLDRAGFSAELRFAVLNDLAVGGTEQDLVLPLLSGDALVKAMLRLNPWLPPTATPGAAPPTAAKSTAAGAVPPMTLELSGLVLDHAYVEMISEKAKGEPVLVRLYTLRCADPARVLWSQHIPCELHVNRSLQDIIRAHCGPHITIEFLDTSLAAPQPLICTGLRDDSGNGVRPTFYDFVAFSLDRESASLTYNYQKNSYQITGPSLPLTALLKKLVTAAKPLPPAPPASPSSLGSSPAASGSGPGPVQTAAKSAAPLVPVPLKQVDLRAAQALLGSPPPKPAAAGRTSSSAAAPPGKARPASPPGAPTTLHAATLARITTYQPARLRYQPRVISAYAKGPMQYTTGSPTAAPGVHRDVLFTTPVQRLLEERVLSRVQGFSSPGPLLLLHFGAFPLLPFTPGGLIDFASPQLGLADENLIVPAAALAEPHRVMEVVLRAEAEDFVPQPNTIASGPASLRMTLTATAQPQSSPARRVPPYLSPAFPIQVEGIVLGLAPTPAPLGAGTKPLAGAGAKPVAGGGANAAALPDLTYQLHPDPDSQEPHYRIRVPLFGAQIVLAPQRPLTHQGASFFRYRTISASWLNSTIAAQSCLARSIHDPACRCRRQHRAMPWSLDEVPHAPSRYSSGSKGSNPSLKCR